VVVLVKPRHRDLHASANAEVKSPPDCEPAQNKTGRQEDLLLSIQSAADQNVEFCSSIGQIFPFIR
jgi:hypothetical protein